MKSLNREALDRIEKRLQIAQTVVWQASESLEEHGDPTTSAAVVFSFDELKEALERECLGGKRQT